MFLLKVGVFGENEEEEDSEIVDNPDILTQAGETIKDATPAAKSKSPFKSSTTKRLFKSPKKVVNVKRRSNGSLVEQTVNMASEALTTMKNIFETKHGRDEYTALGKQVSFILRKLPSKQAKIIAHHKISNIPFEVQMGKYDHGDPSANSPQHSLHRYRPSSYSAHYTS